MKLMAVVLLFCMTGQVMADDVIRIEIGKENKKYTQDELQRRVWSLERAVQQLQARVFSLESGSNSQLKPPEADGWICKIVAMGDTHVGSGRTKAEATVKATENCQKARNGDAFFCKDAKCEQ